MLCPICKKEADISGEFYPFCSERCRLIDLGKWASEKYVVPGAPAPGAGPAERDEAAEEP